MNPIEKLKSMNLLNYGQSLDYEIICQVLGTDKSNKNFIWMLLNLYELLNEEGYFCTQRYAPEGGLRILDAEGCILKCDSLMKKLKKIPRKATNVLLKADFGDKNSDLHKKAEKKLQQFAQAEVAFKGVLGKRYS